LLGETGEFLVYFAWLVGKYLEFSTLYKVRVFSHLLDEPFEEGSSHLQELALVFADCEVLLWDAGDITPRPAF